MAGLESAQHAVPEGVVPDQRVNIGAVVTDLEPAGFAAPASGGVVLRLGGSRFAVAMADVAEVAALPPVTRLPGAPAWLTGVANWRGRMLPLLDIRGLVGAAVTPLASSARLVVIAGGAQGELTAGLVAEAVPGVYDVALDDALPAPATLPAEAARLVSGQLVDALGPIAVLDVEALLSLRERVDRRRHGS
ncbi:MAG: chemotaxis protein CheW [Actinomycetes bacterium]